MEEGRLAAGIVAGDGTARSLDDTRANGERQRVETDTDGRDAARNRRHAQARPKERPDLSGIPSAGSA